MAKKKTAIPPIPPLSVKQAHELETVETNLARAIENCMDGHGKITHELKLSTYLCSYTVKIFTLYMGAYTSSPNIKLWIPQLKRLSAQWALGCLADYRGTTEENLDYYGNLLLSTLDEHVQSNFAESPNPVLAGLAEVHSRTPIAAESQSRSACASETSPSQISQAPNFATELERLLGEARWTPEAIADEMGIDWRTVYRHRTGKMLPSLKTVWAYEQALSKRLNRRIQLPAPAKRQNADKRSVKRQ